MGCHRRQERSLLAAASLLAASIALLPERAEAQWGTDSSAAQQHYWQGQQQADAGELDRAILSYSNAIQAEPNNARWYHARAAAYSKKGDVSRASVDLNQALRLERSGRVTGQPVTQTTRRPQPSVVKEKPKSASQAYQNVAYQQTKREEEAKSATPKSEAPAAKSASPTNQETPSANQPPPTQQPSPMEQPSPMQQPSPMEQPSPISQPSPTAPEPSSIIGSMTQMLASQIAGSAGAPGATVSAQTAAAAGESSTGGLLQQAPSVSVRRTSALNLDPRVRGYRSSQINASANGATLLKSRVDIDSLFSQIDPGVVENLQVIDGPYTSLYGPGFSFLIGELRQSGRYKENETHWSATLSADTNGQNIYTRESVWGGGEMWGYYASYGFRNGNAYMPGDSSNDFPVPAAYNQWDTYFAVGVDLLSNVKADVSYIRMEKNNVELPGVIYDLDRSKFEQFNVRLIMQDDPEGLEQARVQYWWARTPYRGNAGRDTKQRSFYQPYFASNFGGFTGTFAPLDLANTFATGSLQDTGVRMLANFGEKDETIFTVGADWRRYEQFYLETHIDETGSPNNIFFGQDVFGIPQSSMEDYGLFTNLTMPFSEFVSTTVGGRVDMTRAFVSNDLVNAGGRPDTPGLIQLGAPNELMSMLYTTTKVKLTGHTDLDVGVAYAMRNPNLSELYSDDVFVPLIRQGNAIARGNDALTPERNLQFDVGTTSRMDKLTAGVRGFYSTIENYILFRNLGNLGNAAPAFQSTAYEYINIERASLYGGSFLAEYLIRDSLALFTTTAYVKGTNHSPEGGSAEGLPGIYPLATTVGLRFFEPQEQKYSIEIAARMVDGQPFVADSLLEEATPGFTVWDLRAFYAVNKHWRVTSSLENMFDRTYTEHGSLKVVDRSGAQSFVKNVGLNFRLGVQVEY